MAGGHRTIIPWSGMRLLAYVALQRAPVERASTAGILWPNGTDRRAAGNLRSALWRLRRAGVSLLTADNNFLQLASGLLVDVHVLSDWTGRLAGGLASSDDLARVPTTDAVNLLPGCYEDWALIERERLRQQMLHALEALSRQLADVGRKAEAVAAATVAVSADPLRQSAQHTLIEAHLSEGNVSEARRQFHRYRAVLHRELGIEPASELADLLLLPADLLLLPADEQSEVA